MVKISNLSFEQLSSKTQLPVRIAKNLNNELRARLIRHPEHMKESVLNIHWGYGIGTSYALRGDVIHTPLGGFGELGQTTVVDGESSATVESIASLRAMENELRKYFPDNPLSESEFEKAFNEKNVADIPVINRAINLMSVTLANAFLILFPQQIVITGPFARTPEVFYKLQEKFTAQLPAFISDKVTLHVGQRAETDEMFGALSPLFQSEIIKRLKSR